MVSLLAKRSHTMIWFNALCLFLLVVCNAVELLWGYRWNPARYPYPGFFIVLVNLIAWCRQELRARRLVYEDPAR